MPWWNAVRQVLVVGNTLMTPGRGMQGMGQRPFIVEGIEPDKILVHSGNHKIPLSIQCFDAIEQAFRHDPHIKLRIASLHSNEAFPDSADAVIREATQSSLARGNYVCSILVHCKLVKYVMQGGRKCISLH